MFIVRRFQFPARIFAGCSHLRTVTPHRDTSLLLSRSYSSEGRLQALQQLPFASLLLSSSGPQWWQLSWLLISSFPTPYWKSLHAVTETWPKDICIPYIFQFRRDHGPVPPDPLHTWAWNRPTPMSLWEQGCTLHYSLKRLIFKKGLGNLNREQYVI